MSSTKRSSSLRTPPAKRVRIFRSPNRNLKTQRELKLTQSILKKIQNSLERIRGPLSLGEPVSFCDWCDLPCSEKDMKYRECSECEFGEDSILRLYYLKCKWCPKVELKCLECQSDLVE